MDKGQLIDNVQDVGRLMALPRHDRAKEVQSLGPQQTVLAFVHGLPFQAFAAF